MSDPVVDFFEELGARGSEPLLHRASGTLRFDLEHGKKREHWLVTVDKGAVAVSRRNVKADCIVRMDRALFADIVRGRANAIAALLRGVVGVEGDLELLMLFQRLFPGPASTHGDAAEGTVRA